MINLRKEKLNDHWRRTYKRQYPVYIDRVIFKDGYHFEGLSLDIKPGISAIVGKNGTGKSNFIRTLYNCLSGENKNRRRFPSLIENPTVEFSISEIDKKIRKIISPIDGPDDQNEVNISCLLFDPCNLIPEIQKLFQDQDNIEELLEGYESIEVDYDGIRLINFLSNSSYQKVQITNIEDEYEEFPKLPFFVVTKENHSYDSRSMGLGELSVLYFYWLVEYIKKENIDHLLLIEEPESFLPALVQENLTDILAKTSAEQGCSFLISTHSEHILKKIPRTHIHIMKRNAGKAIFLSASDNMNAMSSLGLSSPKKGIIFYEDKAAFIFLKTLIRKSKTLNSDSFLFVRSGSESEIEKSIKALPAKIKNFYFIYVFDGDSRGKNYEQTKDSVEPIFLPTNLPPEEVLVNYIIEKGDSEVAQLAHLDHNEFSAAVEKAAGSDHHDYFFHVATTLEMTHEIVLSKLFDAWVKDEENREEAESFIKKLETLVNQ